MTATDELRRLLDERGVEWKAWDGTHPITVWHDETYLYEFVEYRLVNGAKQVSNCPSDNDGHCELTVKVFNCTPAQAVEATLGRDLEAENADLRREIALSEPLFEALNAANDALLAENAKLRELVRDMAAVICVYDQCETVDDCPPALPMFADKMRELGVDV